MVFTDPKVLSVRERTLSSIIRRISGDKTVQIDEANWRGRIERFNGIKDEIIDKHDSKQEEKAEFKYDVKYKLYKYKINLFVGKLIMVLFQKVFSLIFFHLLGICTHLWKICFLGFLTVLESMNLFIIPSSWIFHLILSCLVECFL